MLHIMLLPDCIYQSIISQSFNRLFVS